MQYFNLALWVGPESETKLVHLICDCSDLMVLPTSVVVSQRCCKHQHNLTETSTVTNLVLLEKVETTYIPKSWSLRIRLWSNVNVVSHHFDYRCMGRRQ